MKSICQQALKTVILFLALLVPHFALAQSDAITLRTERILDGRGGVIDASNIVIRDGTIVEVGSNAAGTVFDLRGLTVMPGGIDTHNHFAWHFDPDGKLHDAPPEEESESERTLYAAENAYSTLMAGITTLQSLGSSVDGPVRDAIARGTLPGPRVLTSLGAITSRTGGPDSIRAAVKQNYFENKQKYIGIGNSSEEGFAHMERAVPKALVVFRRALSTEGLKIVFGTDAVAGAHGHNFEELIYRVEQIQWTPLSPPHRGLRSR